MSILRTFVRLVASAAHPQKLFRPLALALLLTFPAMTHAAGAQAPSGDSVRILAFGDSLTAGYGLPNPEEAFPAQLEKALRAKGHNVSIIQGGVSGDTTTDGRTRLDWSLAAHPDGVILELGANDALRGLDPKLTNDNLRAIIAHIKDSHIPILLAGMMAPPNLGRDFGNQFNPIYPAIAKDTGVLFYPFFLDGVAAEPGLNQADHMHPTAEGVKIIVARILPLAEKLVAAAEAAHAR